jgi:hypothetical protein
MTSAGSFFSPSSITNCCLWLDATDAPTIGLSGSSVISWRDKSGSNNNATSNLSYTAPTRSTINGLTAVNFGTTATQMNLTMALSAQAKSCFAVFRHTVDIFAQTGKFQNFVGTNTSGNLNFTVNGATANTYSISLAPNAFAGNTATYTVPTSSYNFQTATFLTAIQDTTAANNIFTVNGSSATASVNNVAANYNTGSVSLELSRADTLNVNYKTTWLLGEYIQYNGYIAPFQRQQIEGYLAWKWGLQGNLPSTHPYRSYRPYANAPVPLAVPPISFTIGSFSNPATISGLSLWFDAADTTTVTLNGTTVSAWADKSSNAYNVSQATAANQPTYTQNLLNGLPGVVAGGSAVFQLSNANVATANLFESGANFTSFIVMNLTAPPTSDNTSPLAMTGGTTRYAQFGFGPAQSYRYAFDAGQIASPRITATDASMFGSNVIQNVSRATTTTFGMRTNGTALTTALLGTNTNLITDSSLVLRVIWQSSGSFIPVMNVFEVLHYKRALTLAETQQMEGYLAWKWGLQENLPSNHPFKDPGYTPFSYATFVPSVVRRITQGGPYP